MHMYFLVSPDLTQSIALNFVCVVFILMALVLSSVSVYSIKKLFKKDKECKNCLLYKKVSDILEEYE